MDREKDKNDSEFGQFVFFPKSSEPISMTPSSKSQSVSTVADHPIDTTEDGATGALPANNPERDITWTPEEERKLVRKVDLYLLPTIWMMALMSSMDRSNIGYAKVAGMSHDLHLSSDQYSMVIITFYFGFIIWGPFSNMFLARTRPSLYLPGTMIVWGILTCAMAAIRTYPQLVILRTLVGVMEAGISPGVPFLISCWYRPEEQAKRIATVLSASLLGGAFGGLIAGGVVDGLEGVRGIRGFRWLFLCEGLITIVLAGGAMFLLPDFPATCRRFGERERRVAVERVKLAGLVMADGEGRRPLGKMESVGVALRDWRVWVITVGVALVGCSTVLAYFYPTLIQEMGYKSTRDIQFLAVPIWAVAFVCAVASGVVADRFPRHRALMIALCMALGTATSIAVCFVYNSVARYILLVVMAGGIWATIAIYIALVTSTFSDMVPEARAVALSLPGCAGMTGNIYGAYLFPSITGPRYLMGFGVVSGTLGAGSVLFLAIYLLLRKPRTAKDS